MRYEDLSTEQICTEAHNLDTMSPIELVDLIHQQDMVALKAVGLARFEIAQAIKTASEVLGADGRLIYIGAGTSGRLAALDAAECPPTFGVPASQVVAIMAGGRKAFYRAIEGAEDSREEGRRAVQNLSVTAKDVVCGITASGVTPFVLAGLSEAQRRGAKTILITCANKEKVRHTAEIVICLEVGPEVLSGSTRMKAGLATKAVLHTISTATMVGLGKVFDNLMVDVEPKSQKLRRRAQRIVSQLTGLSIPMASRLLKRAGFSAKVAVVMQKRGLSYSRARQLLKIHAGRLRPILGDSIHEP